MVINLDTSDNIISFQFPDTLIIFLFLHLPESSITPLITSRVLVEEEDGNSQEVFDDNTETALDNERSEESIFEASSLLLQNVTLVRGDGGSVPTDVLIKEGRIVSMDTSVEAGEEVVKITGSGGLWLTPGGVELSGDEDNHLTGRADISQEKKNDFRANFTT